MVELILKKRNGGQLNHADFTEIVNGFVSGEIPDYQVAALLMAIYFKGLNSEETAILTEAMMRSGDLIDLSDIRGIKVDKHSTGGVGDKTTIVLAPLVAAAGVPVAKMSGRGLGFTGGTLDKLEAIPGLSVDMSRSDFIDKVKKHGLAVCGQNASLVPADKKLYALRDVTGTVDNMSLISSSVMSKKLACGADAIVIDIKVGEGAYMKTVQQAEGLAGVMIETGAKMGRKVIALLTGMEQPLGFAVGNALEVQEAIDTLKGKGPDDLTELCLALGSNMLILAKAVTTFDEGVEKLKSLISSGKALDKFREFVQMQGGDVAIIDHPELLPTAACSHQFKSQQEGYITILNAQTVGLASMKLGAGRETKESSIDYGAGILLNKKVGDFVKKGELVATLYSNNNKRFKEIEELLLSGIEIKKDAPEKKALVLKTIS